MVFLDICYQWKRNGILVSVYIYSKWKINGILVTQYLFQMENEN